MLECIFKNKMYAFLMFILFNLKSCWYKISATKNVWCVVFICRVCTAYSVQHGIYFDIVFFCVVVSGICYPFVAVYFIAVQFSLVQFIAVKLQLQSSNVQFISVYFSSVHFSAVQCS